MNNLIIFIDLMIFAAVVVMALFLGRFPNRRDSRSYVYKRKDFLMSRPEHEFFDILVGAVGERYFVFPQIHLPSILDCKVIGQNWFGAFRHISQKSVDFVICDKAYIKPLIAIELDDKTHGQYNRKERDAEVERILSEAGIPLLRFGNNGSFDEAKIKRTVLEKLSEK